MVKGRVEAFSDGVVAIIITIMVLELKAPHAATLEALTPLLPMFLSYVLSFVYIGIYWNNHHHMLQAVKSVNGPILWANLHLLFWLSMVPFVTGWLGENHLETAPVALYGAVLFMCALAFTLLTTLLVRHEGAGSALAAAIRHDLKGKASLAAYALGVGLAFVIPAASVTIYVLVALTWFIPDRRIERALHMP